MSSNDSIHPGTMLGILSVPTLSRAKLNHKRSSTGLQERWMLFGYNFSSPLQQDTYNFKMVKYIRKVYPRKVYILVNIIY